MTGGIHSEVLAYVYDRLEQALIEDISWLDPANAPKAGDTKAGWVQIGPNQGDPDIDEARIVVTVYTNDPTDFQSGALTSIAKPWYDEVYEVEVGGVTTMKRRFTVRARCLLEQTGDTVEQARGVASTLRTRIERTLLSLPFTGVTTEDGLEYVSMPVRPSGMYGELYQSGGPEAYDFHVKVRFEILTTITGV